jgi:hypothetical protein
MRNTATRSAASSKSGKEDEKKKIALKLDIAGLTSHSKTSRLRSTTWRDGLGKIAMVWDDPDHSAHEIVKTTDLAKMATYEAAIRS